MALDGKIKFAVVGCGHIGKRHIEMILRNQQAKLEALVDVKDKKDLDLEIYGVPYYNSLEIFLNSRKDVDVVIIATPNGFHAKQALECLEAGKHVIIEKPMALNRLDAEEIIFKSLQISRDVFVVMQNRYSPVSLWVKELIDNNTLGEIYFVNLNCFWNRDERYYSSESWRGNKNLDGGTLFTQFSHFVDIIYWLFGDITNIQGKFKNFRHKEITDFEDSGSLQFDFVNGAIGSFQFSTALWNKNMESTMTIIAQNGTLKIGGQYMNRVSYCHIKDYQMPKSIASKLNDYNSHKGSVQNHYLVIKNVIEVLKDKKSITTNALEGMKIVDIIERIYASVH